MSDSPGRLNGDDVVFLQRWETITLIMMLMSLTEVTGLGNGHHVGTDGADGGDGGKIGIPYGDRIRDRLEALASVIELKHGQSRVPKDPHNGNDDLETMMIDRESCHTSELSELGELGKSQYWMTRSLEYTARF